MNMNEPCDETVRKPKTRLSGLCVRGHEVGVHIIYICIKYTTPSVFIIAGRFVGHSAADSVTVYSSRML